jgi:hypothetical protein
MSKPESPFKPIPDAILDCSMDVQERFCIETVDGKQDDNTVIQSMVERGLITATTPACDEYRARRELGEVIQ